MNTIQKTQENSIVKFIEGIKLFFVTLGAGEEVITPEERIERSGIKELQAPLKSEKILEEKHKQRIVKEASVSEEQANEKLKQQGQNQIIKELESREIEKE